MQFLRSLSFKNTHNLLNLSKEVLIAILLILLSVFYPSIVRAGFLSFGDKVSAKTPEIQDTPNSQNMAVLKAVVNSNPSPTLDDHPILTSANALVAEIGPSGTASELDVPTNMEISLYVVREGDTLSEIANMFDVSVNTIVWANDISRTTALKEGQTLVILPITGIRHTVKKGETIKGIVAKYKADLEEVLEFNGLSINSTIVAGNTIMIPDAEPSIPAASVGKPITPAKTPTYANYYTRPIVGGRRSQGIHGNNGVDLAAPVGTPVYAAAAGTVIASMKNGNWNGGYGNYVIISHSNGSQTLYAHNAQNFVSVGDKVKKGDQIATIGMTGKTTGPHVHFEIRGAKNPF